MPEIPDIAITFSLTEWAEIVAHLGYGNDPEAVAYAVRIRDAVAAKVG